MSNIDRCALGAIAAALLSISFTGQAQDSRQAAAILTMEQARARAARVSDVAYDLAFTLDGALAEFTGHVDIQFQLANASDDLTVDFLGGSVVRTVVNGRDIDAGFNGAYLTMTADVLRVGGNRVEIDFSHPYSSDGSGLYRFRDPEDGRDYLYTDFEPYDQHRLFPSFDQPDLKARYATVVTAPADWQVISIVAESNVVERESTKIWTFPVSAPISTYIYALHAGHYHSWESAAGDIPLRLFARESLVPYIHPEHWFEPTQHGFDFYQEYFEVAYPFGKYDQVIVPHFNAGAMENVGAVTFSERYLSRGTVTRQARRSISSVILHEMAHMWFGDLVTMDWWNGLWLNESFATFMATLAMVENTEFTDEWQSAYRRTIGAYRADERDTTHPIEMPIPDTDAAFANFDSITYGKGSATLTQLNYLVGPEVFRRGVSQYLKTHAYGNTTIDDFLGAISDVAERDLQAWAAEWLHEPGTNTISVDFECENEAIASMSLTQSAPDAWQTLRTHRTQIGLYQFGVDAVTVNTLPVTYAGERTVIREGNGIPCPDMVYANHGDWDYARVQLSTQGLTTLREHLNDFTDPLARLMLWQSTYDMVLNPRMSPMEFIDFALANISAERVDTVTRQALGSLSGAWSYLIRLDADNAHLDEFAAKIESYLWQALLNSTAGSDRQLLMFDSYVRSVSTAAGITRLAAILTAQTDLPDGLLFDQDRRWSVLQTLSGYDHGDVERYLRIERERDNSDLGRLRAMSVEAARPDVEVKRRWVAELLDSESELTVADARAIAGGLFPNHQYAMQLEFTETVFDRLADVSANKDPGYFGTITGGLLGTLCDANYLEQLNRAIDGSETLHPSLKKSLLDMRFEVRRCLAIGTAMTGDD